MLGTRGTAQRDITELVRVIFERAMAAHASDVHIEPTTTATKVRFRIDGALYDQGTLPLSDLESILTRLKVLADLDISAKPIPQDGHFELDTSAFTSAKHGDEALITVGEEPSPSSASALGEIVAPAPQKQLIDVRISIFPTVNGEAAVCRLLNRRESVFALDRLGFDGESLKKVRGLIKKSYGMVLVTGPVGAGKTTVLYSILNETMQVEKNIVTLEDPVEFRFESIRQIQMMPERGLTFAVGMKSILRQDPDVIMIGEIRDHETAEHAVRASLIGRMVFSTIHSNTSIGTVARLLDMNIERSLIAYALNGVIATRLVRKNCEFCRVAYTPSDEYLEQFNLDKTQFKFVRGAGCEKCKGSGIAGRTGIFEILEFDKKLRSLIIEHAPMEDLENYVEKAGLKTLRMDALEKVFSGMMTLEDVAHAV